MPTLPESERILIFDYGSQYSQLIARRVREQNVFCQIALAAGDGVEDFLMDFGNVAQLGAMPIVPARCDITEIRQ